jgi:hypothetical protein
MAITSISGVANIHATRPVDAEHHPRSRRETAQDKQHEEERAQAETPPPNVDDVEEEVVPTPDGEHHIHVIA